MPPSRTERYAIWSACERFRILPPNVKGRWEDCDVDTMADLIAYNQLRQIEEAEINAAMLGAIHA